MKIYKLDKTYEENLKKKMKKVNLTATLSMGSLLFIYFSFTLGDFDLIRIAALFLVISVIMLPIILFCLFLVKRIHANACASHTFEVGDDYILCKHCIGASRSGMPASIKILKGNIRTLTETDKGLTINKSIFSNTLFLISALEGYDELKALLYAWERENSQSGQSVS